MLQAENPQDPKQDALIRKVYDGLQQGKIDRSLFTDNANAYFTEQALKDYASSLGPLGAPQSFTQSNVFAAWRDDGADLRREVSEQESGHHHLRNARRKVRAVPDCRKMSFGKACP